MMPGSFADQMVYQGASPETVEAFKENWGLNDPLHIQYIRYMENLMSLDMGTSVAYRTPVIEIVWRRIFNSFILIAPAITLAYIVGSFIGLIAGVRRGSFFERYGLAPILFFGSTPSFVLAVFAIVLFAGILGIFPTGGMLSVTGYSIEPWWRSYLTSDFLWHYTLPFGVIASRYLLLPSLIMRTNVVEVLGQDFINYQRIAGIPRRTRWRQIAKHSSLPVITMYPVSMTRAIGGLVLVELVFNWPGIGSLLVESIFVRDTPIVQFVFMLMAIFVILSNFAVDIIYGLIDPRVSVGDSD
jgi:peptide/nickel transport system permease protein